MLLQTARLVIRTFEPHDAEPWIAMMTDPEVRRFLPPGPVPTMETFQSAIARRHAKPRGTRAAGMRYEGLATYYGMTGLKKYVAERDRWRSPLAA